MSVIYRLVARDERISSASTLDPTMVKLLIALLVLVFIAIVALGCLMLLRSIRRSRPQDPDSLPLYENSGAFCSKRSNHRRLTISAQSGSSSSRGHESVYVIQEKQRLIANSSSPPSSPIPEIRITFPEEVDSTGKRHSGRVVVVRVGEHSVGLEPVQDKEDLPPYMRDEQRFQSLDLERMGGLKEKEYA